MAALTAGRMAQTKAGKLDSSLVVSTADWMVGCWAVSMVGKWAEYWASQRAAE